MFYKDLTVGYGGGLQVYRTTVAGDAARYRQNHCVLYRSSVFVRSIQSKEGILSGNSFLEKSLEVETNLAEHSSSKSTPAP